MRRWPAIVGVLALLLAACTPAFHVRIPGKVANHRLSPNPTAAPGAHWVPQVGMSWQYQLSGTVATNVDAAVFDIDGVDNSSSTVAALHAAGHRAVCYVDAGSWEPGRPDSGQFPPGVKGKALDGWPDERWLDIRQINVLEPIMAARFDVCRQKGFDAVEADNVDGYGNDTGFSLSGANQIAYNKLLAGLAHDRGLAIGLKNDLDQVPTLVGYFDFAVNEQCNQFNECDTLVPFIRAGKPVFNVEYSGSPAFYCPAMNARHFSSIRKSLNLDAPRQAC
ncbi:MAG: endo alpha,4 polygalactosaminidase [Actinomycetia bacterium]|nr:endo alpha,4 polygalactosaminidase [Actinomycetes bacterium]